MEKQTDIPTSDASEISQLREELNRLKLKFEHTPATQADDQLSREASRQRAKGVTIAKLGELHWSFTVPSHAVLSSATNWAAWFKNVQYALRELCLEIEDLKYLDSATHTRLLRQMHMALSTKLQNKGLDCEDFEESIDILRAATIGSRQHSEDDYAERLREFDFLPGESLSKMVDRYENLADEATSLGVKLDEKYKVTNLRVVISAKFPDLYLHLIVHKSWSVFLETVHMVTKFPKYKKAPIPRQNREQRTSATAGRRGGSCYNCDESGHHSNQCSKPRDAAKINAKINVKISSKRALGRQQNQGKNTNSSVHALDDENDEGIGMFTTPKRHIHYITAECLAIDDASPNTNSIDNRCLTWIADTRATTHAICHEGDFVEGSVVKCNTQVMTGNGSTVAYKKGVVIMHMPESNLKVTLSTLSSFSDPSTPKQALAMSDKWRDATDKEIETMLSYNVFEFTDKPVDKKLIRLRWVFRIKTHGRYKARLVARGDMQREGFDYGQTFASTSHSDSWRILMATAVMKGRVLRQFDIKAAYLHGIIQEDAYVSVPKELEDYFQRNPHISDHLGYKTGMVIKLKRTLYGLEQSGHEWQKVMKQYLMYTGFKQVPCDLAAYRNESLDITVCTHIDDLLYDGPNEEAVKRFERKLMDRFHGELTETPKWLLGVTLGFNPNSIELDQIILIDSILEEAGMNQCQPSQTPAPLPPSNPWQDTLIDHRFRRLVGRLMYQNVVARSTLEAELIAMSDAMAAAMFMKSFATQTGHDIEITGFADNKGSLTTANRTDATSRATRHIRADHFYIREKVADGSVALELVDTRHQIADALTKPLSAPLTKKYNKVLSGGLDPDKPPHESIVIE
ncbi:Importin beta-related nuclear transport receptor [Ceratocystis lukuohia]|uniref:Importin beta-related nuclear transport receptor n=1 Tax=Ceratocystis lukuohia TaxID=2019550 RepID=A0ABR4MFB8_9PEZI